MITVKIFRDGSAMVTWQSCRAGVNYATYRSMARAQVEIELKEKCLNAENGCGLCLTCRVHAAQAERSKR